MVVARGVERVAIEWDLRPESGSIWPEGPTWRESRFRVGWGRADKAAVSTLTIALDVAGFS